MRGIGVGNQLHPKKGWSTSGKITCNVGGSNMPQGQVALQCDFQADPDAYTVGFATGNAVGNGVQVRALIVGSVEGSSICRVIDVDAGASLTLVSQAANIIVYDQSPPFSQVGTVTYDVFIQVSKGTRGTFTNPPRLTALNPATGLPAFTIPATGTVNVAVPTGPNGQLAGAVSVNVAISGFPDVVPDDSVQVQMFNSGNFVMAYDPRDMQWAPLAPGTQFLQLANHNAFTVLATCTFGIDG